MSAKFDEESLRKKIREQLEKEHSEQKKSYEKQLSDESVAAYEADESYYLEIYIRRKLQDEVYSKHPEFVECGNHLGQVKWLTPLEMEEEYEFFPVEYTFWAKIRNLFSSKTRVKVSDNPEIKKMIEEFREEIEENAANRIKKYKAFLETNNQVVLDDRKQKIINEEQDRFYRSLKGYHKYQNHIGETKWMNEEEFDAQDEYTDRYYSKKEKWIYTLVAVTSLFILIFASIFLYDVIAPDKEIGYVLVKTSDSKARVSLYVNQNLAMGFTPGVPYPLEEGSHEIAVISPQYKTEPSFHRVDISVNDTTLVEFSLVEVNGNSGVIRMNVPYMDAGVYADGEFKGTIQRTRTFSLPVGDHSVTIKKENYLTRPRVQTFTLNAGDTIDLSFKLTHLKEPSIISETTSSLNVGLIEINSNVPGAEIILNGHKTGFSTDYVLQKIPLGQHLIRVEKEGYKIYPEEKVVRLTKDSRKVKVDFTLTSTNRFVTIVVNPKQAPIYVDGQKMDEGTFRGNISLGEHEITFGNIDKFINPGKQKILVTRDGENRFEFTYRNDIYFEVKNGSIIPSSDIRLSSGYILNGINYKANSTNGPEVVQNEVINQKVWNLGFAFQYKNPPGSDALYIRFNLPNDLNISDDTSAKLWLYQTDESYPLVIGGQAEYMIIINNRIVIKNKTPRYNASQISENNYEEIVIASYLKPGVNNIIISCAPDNTKFMHLWKIVIN